MQVVSGGNTGVLPTNLIFNSGVIWLAVFIIFEQIQNFQIAVSNITPPPKLRSRILQSQDIQKILKVVCEIQFAGFNFFHFRL